MALVSRTSLEALVAFTQLVSEVREPREILSFLADATVQDLGAAASAVFEINHQTAELTFVASRNLPPSVAEMRTELGEVGAGLTKSLLEITGKQFAQARSYPLVNNTDVYGVLTVFFQAEETSLNESQLALLESLVHLSAIALGKADQYARLRQAYSDLQASQEVLARTEKLRALGQMSASISHDLKNLLTPLILQVSLLKRLLESAHPSQKIVDQLERSVRRGIETVERLRDFSRQSPDPVDGEIADLNQLVTEAVELCRPRFTSGLHVDSMFSGNLPQIPVRSADCVSALVNILFNAVDALGGEGQVKIRTGESNQGAWVEITDNGPGMPEEVKRRIFEPFFTTKGKEGTGLGLAMVYALVQRSGGRITVNSAPGKGTSFKLWFPPATSVQATGTS